MIGYEEAIAQDQLVASSNPGKVCINYPRGTQGRLVFDATATPPALRVDTSVPPLDNAFSQWFLVGGNLAHLLDRPTVIGCVILGQGLTQP